MSMRVVALLPEAFGGRGGIALYNKDLLTALCELENCSGVTALPRLIRDSLPDSLPTKLDFRAEAAGGGARFLLQWLRLLSGGERYDLILCGHINLLPFAEALRRRFRAPLVLLIYGIDAWQPPARRLNLRLARTADAVVSISDFTRRRFAKWSGVDDAKLFLLPNALHPRDYGLGDKPRHLVERYGLEGTRVIMTLGRLSAAERYKGVDEVVDLMPALLDTDAGIRYLVVGDGDDRARLQEKARKLGLGSQVKFAGWIDESEKADYYRLADAFVMAGRGEGFGFVFLEAMACGIPVVASRLDGSREAVLGGELGLLANPDDGDELRAAIEKALNSPRRVPEGLAHFHYPRFRERLEEILDAVQRREAQPA